MVAPSFVAAGSGAAAAGASGLTVGCPASGITAGDLLIAHFSSEGTVTSLTSSGWVLPTGFASSFQYDAATYWLMLARIADGTENGTSVVFAGGGGTSDLYGRIYCITDVQAAANTSAGVGGIIEGLATTTGTDSSIEVPSLTTSGADRLGVALVAVADDNALDAFSGGTGGTWAEAVAEYTSTAGTDGALGLQVVTLAAAGTISGGVDTMAAADAWCVRVFALKPAAGAAPERPRWLREQSPRRRVTHRNRPNRGMAV